MHCSACRTLTKQAATWRGFRQNTGTVAYHICGSLPKRVVLDWGVEDWGVETDV